MRIVADVNVLVSATIAPLGIPRAIVSGWMIGRLELVTADGILAELEQKLRSGRIRTRYHLSEQQIRTAIDTLRRHAELVLVPPHAIPTVTGDPEDDYVLAATARSGAEYLVTGDIALQSLGAHEGVRIVSPRQFLDLFQLQHGETSPESERR